MNSSRIALPRYSQCFVCGNRNSIGLGITFYYVQQHIETEFVPRDEHAGYQKVVHGGILATLLDETMGWSVICSRPILCFSVELSIRYRSPAMVGEPLRIVGELISDKKRMIHAKGWVENQEGKRICSGEGKYVPLTADQQADVTEYAKWGSALDQVYEQIQAMQSGK